MKSYIFGVVTLVLLLDGCLAKRKENEPNGKKLEECTTEFRGCKLQSGDCVCGTTIACSNPYPYINEHQCNKDITGALDKCRKEPCVHGQCVQIKKDDGHRKWECSCSGSGYFGKRCQNECPPLKKGDPIPKNYPTDCIY